jgi:sec-independent protein translocase protein TatA
MNLELAVFGGLGGWEILLIVLVLLIFFGAKKIPELARGLGKGIREFKEATSEIKDEIEEGVKDIEKSVNQTTDSTKK